MPTSWLCCHVSLPGLGDNTAFFLTCRLLLLSAFPAGEILVRVFSRLATARELRDLSLPKARTGRELKDTQVFRALKCLPSAELF